MWHVVWSVCVRLCVDVLLLTWSQDAMYKNGVHIAITCLVWLNNPCTTSVWPYVTLLWLLVFCYCCHFLNFISAFGSNCYGLLYCWYVCALSFFCLVMYSLGFSWILQLWLLHFQLNIVFVHSSLPELLEKKRLVDLHTNVATAILEQIKVINCWIFTATRVCSSCSVFCIMLI